MSDEILICNARLVNEGRIEEGDLDWIDALREFQKKFDVDLEKAKKNMRDVKREAIPTDQTCDKCGKPMVLKWGKFGQFLACSGYPDCKNTREIASSSEVDMGDESTMKSAAKTAKTPPIRARGRFSNTRKETGSDPMAS